MGLREDVYDNEIAPLMTRIIEICQKHEIPVLATFQYTEPGEEAGFCTTSIPAPHEDAALADVKRRWYRVRRGGEVSLAITEVTDGSHTTIGVRRL